MPGYYRSGDIFYVSYITGPSHVCLGLKLCNGINVQTKLVCKSPIGSCSHGGLDETEILSHVVEGVNTANKKYGKSYSVSEIEYVENDSPRYDIFRRCAFLIVEGISSSKKFE